MKTDWILILNIKELVGISDNKVSKLCGDGMKKLTGINDAFLMIFKGKIMGYGKMKDMMMGPAANDNKHSTIIDAKGKMVFPSWCDSHTHLVYAGSREKEFVDRINGMTYEEIAKRGGGILNSAKLMAKASEEELYDAAWKRLEEIISTGTGAVEIKSGYGLSLETELKMLRVIKRLKETSPLTIKSTFLGAHAVPTIYENNKEEYIDLIVQEMIPAVAQEKLAEYCDVFCEKNYFNKEETIRILETGLRYGLKPKVHAEQLSN